MPPEPSVNLGTVATHLQSANSRRVETGIVDETFAGSVCRADR